MDTFADSGLVGGLGVFGGTFDPVHIGHLRMAIEVREALALRRVLVVPSFAPPHKPHQPLLPFDLRAALLQAACHGEDGLEVSLVEQTLPSPSYTVHTVAALRERFHDESWAFIMGSTDFVQLPSWHEGLKLPHRVDMVVVERMGVAWKEVDRFARVALGLTRTSWGWRGKRCILYLRPPLVEVSSSLVRERFLAGRSLRGLVPDACYALLHHHRQTIERLWRKEEV